MLGAAGEIAIPVTVTAAAFTVSLVIAFMPFMDAVIFVLPAVTPVAIPSVSMVATTVFDEFQDTEDVMFCVVPSL